MNLKFGTGVSLVMTQSETQAPLQYIKGILAERGKINCSYLAGRSGCWSHDALTRFLNGSNDFPECVVLKLAPLLVAFGAYFILDDTVIKKPHSRPSKEVGKIVRYLYSNTEGQVVVGINIVLLLVVVAGVRIPIGFRVYDKRKTKIQLALELLSFARNRLGVRKSVLLFDSWYCTGAILKRVNDYGWIFVCRIKKNRRLSGKRIDKCFSTPRGTLLGSVSGVRVRAVKHDKYFLIANRVGLSGQEIRRWYQHRSKIEEVFRILKTELNANDCQSRSHKAWSTHLSCSILAFVVLEKARRRLGVSVYKARLSHYQYIEGLANSFLKRLLE